ncbi:MAG: hypothetical protein H7246_06155 [Phycisphaerae bacterium]|nr:hypothetical protein [Saprospiraceae bacterium]
MLKHALLPTLFFLLSCNSPEARFKRLQHDFWEKFAQQDFFEIKLKNEVLHLPLPPNSPPSEQQKSWAERLQKEANSIEKEELSGENQKQLIQLRAALEDCVAHAGGAFFDPSRCVVLKPLQQFSDHEELLLLLEKIPAYYAQIEQRWQTPDARFVLKAVTESQNTLDLLNGLEKKSGGEIVAQTGEARAAVKDFIGLCQSALLQ